MIGIRFRSEIKLMLGHSSGDTTDIYINSRLKRIRDKLDVYAHRVTVDEMFREELERGLTFVEIIKSFIRHQDYTVSSDEEGDELDKRIAEVEKSEHRVLDRREVKAILSQIRAETEADNPSNFHSS
jgi:hypothetical protein